MTHLPEIWLYLQSTMPSARWISLQEIYDSVNSGMKLDAEDYDWQSPTSHIPKWKRNVRNVLQYRKKTGELDWDGDAKYRLSTK